VAAVIRPISSQDNASAVATTRIRQPSDRNRHTKLAVWRAGEAAQTTRIIDLCVSIWSSCGLMGLGSQQFSSGGSALAKRLTSPHEPH
jgi:hypothetical protein